MKSINIYYRLLSVAFCIGIFCSCKKYLDISLPKDKLTDASVFSTPTNTLAAVNGLYTFAFKSSNFLNYQGDLLLGIAADEFVFGNTQYDEFMNNNIPPDNQYILTTWQTFYSIIYQANAIIENVPGSPVPDSLKQVYIAEAKVFRAYCHLYLTSYFGDVPLITTTNITVTAFKPRTPKGEVMAAVIADLKDAEGALPVSTVRNGRINKYVATALLARVYLYQGDWANAETKATSLIANNTNFSLLTDPNSVFLRGSKEAIWQINTSGGTSDNYTYFAGSNVPPPGATSSTLKSLATLRPELYNAFEPGDLRKTAWVGYNNTIVPTSPFYYDNKYKQVSTPTSTSLIEDYMLLRLAEQYLIRAEARAQQQNLNSAIDDINVIRTRAGLTTLTPGLSQSNILLAIEKERKLELFGEGYGHRWIDLIRTNRANAVLGAEKPTTWKSTATLFPIPTNEILTNPNLTPNP